MKSLIFISLIFVLLLPEISVAQIHDIKKKSAQNKQNGSRDNNNFDFDSEADVASDFASCCFSNVFSMLIDGCLTSIFDGSNNNADPNNDVDNDYLYEEPPSYNYEYENFPNEQKDLNVTKRQYDSGLIQKTDKENNFTLDVNLLFDISMHKGIDKYYSHVDYLPGLRAGLNFLMLDFRFNILTQNDIDDMDAFESWELLFLLNLTANQNYSAIIGTGIHREQFNNGNSFNEFFAGCKIPINNQKSNIDISCRFSVDYKTDAFPFFEFSGRYNHKLFSMRNLSTYITIGLTYQNYYESYDILGLRSGIFINL